MILDLKLDRKATEQMNKLVAAATFNWRTNLIGVAGVVLGVIQGLSNDTTLNQLFHDGRFGMLLLIGLLGFVAKNGSSHGTAEAPISVPQAQAIAAVAATVAPSSAYVGGAVPGATDLFIALPEDLTPVGQVVAVGGQNFKKLSAKFYEKQ